MRSSKMRLAVLALVLTAFVALQASPAPAEVFRLTSHDTANGQIRQEQVMSRAYGYGCSGGNLSPDLEWSGAPQGTQSFVLTIFDMDAPNGLGWFHWVVVDIPSTVSSLPTGASGSGIASIGALETRTDFGVPGYGGPCPPSGTAHRYRFVLSALRIPKLPIDANATPAMVGIYVEANKLDQASFTAVYGR
jgi:Raf kinase inhibitor-like YbhB/YbcL family protein